jgi:hypothetical protein
MSLHMPARALREAERRVQLSFRKSSLFSALVIAGVIIGLHRPFLEMPDRNALPDTSVALRYVPASLSRGPAALRLVGAWELNAADPRLDGLSALQIDGAQFLALSDSGVVVRFDRPGAANPTISFRDLPSGPGRVDRKSGNDSEALARDPEGRGWWVAFEWFHQLRLYDPDFLRTLAVKPLDGSRWSENGGIEGLVRDDVSLVLVAEDGKLISRFDGETIAPLPSMSGSRRLSDAAALADGRILLLQRTLSPLGFRNALAIYDPTSGRTIDLASLPLGHLDNAEGLAVERLVSGRLRVWIITDRDSRARGRTLLAAFDWDGPNAKRPAQGPGAR